MRTIVLCSAFVAFLAAPSLALAQSPNGTVIPSASQIVDGQGNVWTVNGGVVYENAAKAGFSQNVTELLYQGGKVYQENDQKGWWYWSGKAWVGTSNPTQVGGGYPVSRAYDFENRIGVNAQPDYLATVQQTINEFKYLGHVWNDRDAIQQAPGEYADPAKSLWLPIVHAGIQLHLEYTVQGVIPMSEHMGWLHEIWSAVPGSIRSVAGPNEADLTTSCGALSYDGKCEVAAADQIQHDLYAAMKADPTLKAVPVAMWPASINVIYQGNNSVPRIGNMTASCDMINMHDYYTPDELNNYGNASNGTWAGNVPVAIKDWGQFCNRAPAFLTSESGINTDDVGDDVQSKNALKQILDHVLPPLYGTPGRFYYFNLTNNASGNWGMFQANGAPKQLATNLRDMLTILWDGGAAAKTFSPATSYAYKVSSQCPDCYSGVIEKSSGAFDIILWNETPIYECPANERGVCNNSNGGHEVTIGTTNETVTLPAAANVALYDPVHHGQSIVRTWSNVSTVPIGLNDSPLILQITP